jgi:NADPH:quinone reductase-like Zn-dependent oxidoreductase
VNQGRLKPGQRVLIHAGAGGVGVMAIQIAKAFGAYVAATASTRNQDLLRELGADLAIDYTHDTISKLRPKFDLVLDTLGEKVWSESFRALKVGGRLITLTPPIPEQSSGKLRFYATAVPGIVFGVVRGLLSGKRLSMTRVKPRGGELEKISTLIEAGKLRPIVEKVFTLEQIAEAHRLSQAGHVRGKLVIRIRGEG